MNHPQGLCRSLCWPAQATLIGYLLKDSTDGCAKIHPSKMKLLPQADTHHFCDHFMQKVNFFPLSLCSSLAHTLVHRGTLPPPCQQSAAGSLQPFQPQEVCHSQESLGRRRLHSSLHLGTRCAQEREARRRVCAWNMFVHYYPLAGSPAPPSLPLSRSLAPPPSFSLLAVFKHIPLLPLLIAF